MYYTETDTVTSVSTDKGSPVTVTKTQTDVYTYTETDYYTYTTTVPGVCTTSPSCPTITSTATYCKSCLVPDCTSTSTVNKVCGCDTLPTAVVSFPCSDPDSCNKIGCKTVYATKTAKC